MTKSRSVPGRLCLAILVLLLLQWWSIPTVSAQVVPPQPTNLSAFHRSGQTFLTWSEREDLEAESYRVYRSDGPISAANLSQANLLYDVPAGSGRFFANRYRDYASPPNWTERHGVRYVIQDGGNDLAPGTGLLVWTITPLDLSAASSGYYAVTTVSGGVENVQDFTDANTVGPLVESVAAPKPVALPITESDRWHPFIQYMDLQQWNPTFHAPHAQNGYYGLDPNDPEVSQAIQYAYDYAVYLPTEAACGGELPTKLPLFVSLHAWQGNVYPPPTRAPNSFCAYTLRPVDVSESWWFGFARRHDFRAGGAPGAGDTIVNYTEQRVLQMVDALIQAPIGSEVDRDRIYVSGHSMGGSGALAFALRFPDLFAAAYASKPMTDYRNAGGWLGNVQTKWGAVQSGLPISITAPSGWADHLAPNQGANVWEWQNHQEALATRVADPMVPFGMAQGINDTSIAWTTQAAPAYGPLNTSLQAWSSLVTDDGHAWGAFRGLAPNLAPGPQGIPFADLQVVRSETVPGLSNGSANLTMAPAITPTTTGGYNQNIRWSASWDDWDSPPADQQQLWQMSFCVIDETGQCGAGPAGTSDVTPRRIQHFDVEAGKAYRWRVRRVPDDLLLSSGAVSADKDGLITIPAMEILPNGVRLTLLPADQLLTSDLQVAIRGEGRVERMPEQPDYEWGQRVMLRAIPEAGWLFAGWKGSAAKSVNPIEKLIDGNEEIVATFVEVSGSTLFLPMIIR